MIAVAHVELDGGILTASTLHTFGGPYAASDDIGSPRYFVSYVEADGGNWCLWDGPTYDEAVLMAEKVRQAFGITEPVNDRVVGGVA